MISARRVLAMIALAVAVVALPGVALASFTGPATASLKLTSSTLRGPSGVTLSKRCGSFLFPSGTLTVDWTASTDATVTGYTITMTTSSDSTTKTVSGRTTTQTSFPITIRTTYNVTVAATYRNWTSATATTGSVTCSAFGN